MATRLCLFLAVALALVAISHAQWTQTAPCCGTVVTPTKIGDNNNYHTSTHVTGSVVTISLQNGPSCNTNYSNGTCTQSHGYWFQSASEGPLPYDHTWDQVGETTPFFISGTTWYGVDGVSPRTAYYFLAVHYVSTQLNFLAGAWIPNQVQNAFNEATALFQALTPAQVAVADPTFTILGQFLSDYDSTTCPPGVSPPNATTNGTTPTSNPKPTDIVPPITPSGFYNGTCALSQGYWFQHSSCNVPKKGKGPARDTTWDVLPSSENTPFYSSGYTWCTIGLTAPQSPYVILAQQYVATRLDFAKTGVWVPNQAIQWYNQATSLFLTYSVADSQGSQRMAFTTLATQLEEYAADSCCCTLSVI